MFDSVKETVKALQRQDYIADAGLATSLFLALKLRKAIFLEGEPGVGKTEIAKVLSLSFEVPLIRLQCYEGLDINHAVYEWNYPRQLLAIHARQTYTDGGGPSNGSSIANYTHESNKRADGEVFYRDIYTEDFLLKRPLLQAIDQSHDASPVLLIDELDRADEEFESFLLELLSDFQITIPEIGALRARHRPIVIITSNRTREIHDALKRRCVYHWIDYPSRAKELQIVRLRLPGIGETLSQQVVDFVQWVRGQDVYRSPGVSETLDWAEALGYLNVQRLGSGEIHATLGLLLKSQEDVNAIQGMVNDQLLEKVLHEFA